VGKANGVRQSPCRHGPREVADDREVAGRGILVDHALVGKVDREASVGGNRNRRRPEVQVAAGEAAFLNRYPSLYGYVLVAPKDHREQVTGDFSLDEYLHLQAVVHRVGEAICQVVPTERLYVLSLGSQQANRHVHWHLAPTPSGLPFEQQQLAALDSNMVLDLTQAEQAELASRLRDACAG
jgi:diadenosine tetraphosphate (Ap4A) HIT family hydrolase